MATSCDYCSASKTPNCKHYRAGKTKKDKESGAWGQRFANRALRVSWASGTNVSNSNFPRGSCNGRKNRFVTT